MSAARQSDYKGDNIMSILNIVELGDPILRKRCKKIKDVFDPNIKTLIKNMFKSMDKAKGVGLAAPQVGLDLQLFLVSPNGKHKAPFTNIENSLVVMNPKLEFLDNKTAYEWEGCLSIPGYRGQVKRPNKIKLNYINTLGENCEEIYEGFTARIIQHEYDHLQGVLFLDRMKDLSTLMTDSYFEKLLHEYQTENT